MVFDLEGLVAAESGDVGNGVGGHLDHIVGSVVEHTRCRGIDREDVSFSRKSHHREGSCVTLHVEIGNGAGVDADFRGECHLDLVFGAELANVAAACGRDGGRGEGSLFAALVVDGELGSLEARVCDEESTFGNNHRIGLALFKGNVVEKDAVDLLCRACGLHACGGCHHFASSLVLDHRHLCRVVVGAVAELHQDVGEAGDLGVCRRVGSQFGEEVYTAGGLGESLGEGYGVCIGAEFTLAEQCASVIADGHRVAGLCAAGVAIEVDAIFLQQDLVERHVKTVDRDIEVEKGRRTACVVSLARVVDDIAGGLAFGLELLGGGIIAEGNHRVVAVEIGVDAAGHYGSVVVHIRLVDESLAVHRVVVDPVVGLGLAVVDEAGSAPCRIVMVCAGEHVAAVG